MGKKRNLKILTSELENEIREVVRDEIKKCTKTDMKKLLDEIDKIIADKIIAHLLSVSTFITEKLGNKK